MPFLNAASHGRSQNSAVSTTRGQSLVFPSVVEMPDRMAENLIRFIRLNEGNLGRKRREGEFEKLTDDEVASIEAIVQEAFEGFEK